MVRSGPCVLRWSLILWASTAVWLPAQIVNSWTDPHSGSWEVATNWSQGIRPASNQTAEITNSGYKAVGISASTVSSFSDSLTVANLTISAPSDSANTLLLNYAGTGVPLHVLNACTIGTNATLENIYSSLVVDGVNSGRLVITDGGQFIQEGGVTVISPTTELPNGTIRATNANITLGTLNVGFVSDGTSGNVFQSGGSLLCAGLRIDSGTYTLLDNAAFYALDKTLLYGVNARFNQVSGTNLSEIIIYDGYYHFYDGYLRGNDWSMLGIGSFFQHGGTAEFGTMEVFGSQNGPDYRIESGTLRCGTLFITGRFQEFGGTVILTNGLSMNNGFFDLVGGTISMPSMVISNSAVFNHFFGTNQVVGDVALYNTALQFEGGRFTSANLGVGLGAAFGQESGSNEVSGVLSITGSYYMGSGVLSVNGLWLRGSLTLDFGRGNLDPVFLNSGTINFGGTINISSSQNSMGQVILATNGTINLSASPLVVRFANSSVQGWDSNSHLVIAGWNGSYSGNGSNQIYFGHSSSGLTPGQLAQVRFLNPGGSPPGNYNAQILSTGEVVPVPLPVLQFSRSGNELILNWLGNLPLLTATNVNGPYQLVSGATSPYTNDMRTAPQQFFILQSQ